MSPCQKGMRAADPAGAGTTSTMSWVIWVIRHALESNLAGPINAVSPNPTTHRLFIKALGRALHRPVVLPIPKFVLKVILGTELAEALVLNGQKVVPARLQADGFRWNDIDLEKALRAALAS